MASSAKARGNAAMKAGRFDEAVACYTEGVEADRANRGGNLHVLYSNRSAAQLSAGRHAMAVADAQRAIDAKPDWSRGHMRRAAALHRQGELAPGLAMPQRSRVVALQATHRPSADGAR